MNLGIISNLNVKAFASQYAFIYIFSVMIVANLVVSMGSPFHFMFLITLVFCLSIHVFFLAYIILIYTLCV